MVRDDGTQMWVCEAQEQDSYAPGLITAFAVGIRDAINNFAPPMKIVQVTSTPGTQPEATAALAAGGFVISGCGGKVEAQPASPFGISPDHQLLTAVFPNASAGSVSGCEAKASDYGAATSGAITAYAVNLLLDRDVLTSAYPNEGPTGTSVLLQGPRFSPEMQVQFVDGSHPPTIVTPVLELNSVHKALVTVPNGLHQESIIWTLYKAMY
jgi:hypothetical protein